MPESYSEFCSLRTGRRVTVCYEFSYHEAFEAQERVVTRCRGQHRQHSEPGQTLRQAGNKPESTLTSQVQYRALAIARGSPRRVSACEISKSTGFHEDFVFQIGFLHFTWISGFQCGFLDFTWISGFLDFTWISGFQSGFLPMILDFV